MLTCCQSWRILARDRGLAIVRLSGWKAKSDAMKILLLSNSPNDPDAGASRVYHLLSAEWRALGHEVRLMHLEDYGLPTGRFAKRLVVRTSLPSWMTRAIVREVRFDEYDCIVAASGHGGDLFRRIARKRRPLLVNHFHGLAIYDHAAAQFESQTGAWRASAVSKVLTGPIQARWDRQGAMRADINIVQNIRDKDYVERVFGQVAHVIPPPLHPTIAEASKRMMPFEARNPADLLWFGSWEPRKGAAHVPRAFRKIRERAPDARLTIGGTGKDKGQLLALFDTRDRSNVVVLPRISMEEQMEFFNRSAIFLFPSLSEGFGLALVEAMSMGCAAITGSTGFASDYLRDGRDCLITPVSAEHIADRAVSLIGDGEFARQIAENGRRSASNFSVGDIARKYLELFSEAISTRKQA